jgi:glycosyltransferase involved in cell wall biosynthesis
MKVERSLAAPKASRASAVATGAPVTAIVLTLNEEANLPDCLDSLSGWVQEVIVVDSGSTDATVRIARERGARVEEHPFENYGAQRNWALDKLEIRTPWVLNVDADERVTVELRDSIVGVLAEPRDEVQGYLVTRRTVFLGQWIRHGGHYPAWHLRLFRVGKGRCEDRLYDQHFLVDGKVERLPGDLIDTLTADLGTFVRRHVGWAALEAREQTERASGARVRPRLLSRNPVEVRRWLRTLYDRLPLFVRPVLYFVYRYFLRLGFLDGRKGFIFHVLQGFWYRFLIDSMILELRRGRSYERVSAPESTRR